MKEGYIVAAGPIPHRKPIERIAARRAFIDANTYTYAHHGTCIRWKLRNRCAREEQFLLFDLFKAFD